jgi:hypothetical protein
MSEFWARSPGHRVSDNDRFFMKQPASAAHTYGRRLVLGEGFTDIGLHWQETLWDNLKPSFDRAACEAQTKADRSDGYSVAIKKAYLIGKTEVTQGQWKAVMRTNPSLFQADRVTNPDNHPVEGVTWQDTQAFVQALIERASAALATIPDVLNYWLSGTLVSEYTIATTTQMVDARTRTWAIDLLNEIGLPGRLLQPIVEAGSITGALQRSASTTGAGTPIVAPACHDTGSAVASVNASAPVAFLSSGTWSLLGTEVREPVITSRALALNFTNEGGVCGTTRLLKNIAGLWLLQSCRRLWQSSGQALSYETLIAAAAEDRPRLVPRASI